MENCITKMFLYIDNEKSPIAELEAPVTFNLDTTKLADGEHTLKIVSKSEGKEGLKIINFTVRNGPIIHIVGLSDKEVVNGSLPIMLNSYNNITDNHSFAIKGSESPRTIPIWVWVIILAFVAWAAYYIIMYHNLPASS
ncbi:cytochrome C [Elizabethkingia sp. JS20170427COW]|uniref:cytochrome C n=1 Tax=Elizabethkingia sp. JS20170427COW TaxID=2583851 RepID=UPI001110FA60|nr:cytochrome C [Elizabethkingia sp. JS20170427COW]QCX53892.1 cytochrome C [Elizabethkingia sp. JS20170427COW]